jgi:hypothetical protein
VCVRPDNERHLGPSWELSVTLSIESPDPLGTDVFGRRLPHRTLETPAGS